MKHSIVGNCSRCGREDSIDTVTGLCLSCYNPDISYSIMKRYGDHSDELRDYLDSGKEPEL